MSRLATRNRRNTLRRIMPGTCQAGMWLRGQFQATVGHRPDWTPAMVELFGPEYLAAAGRAMDRLACNGAATDLHEPWTRARGGPIDSPQNVLPVCRSCHGWLTDYAVVAELLLTRDGMPYVLRNRTAFERVWPDVAWEPVLDLLTLRHRLCPVGVGISEPWRLLVRRCYDELYPELVQG